MPAIYSPDHLLAQSQILRETAQWTARVVRAVPRPHGIPHL